MIPTSGVLGGSRVTGARVVVFTAISCRKMHPESNYGHYVPPLDERGIPRKRAGFHVRCAPGSIAHDEGGTRRTVRTRSQVPCLTDSQCHSRCGDHPIHGAAHFDPSRPLARTDAVVVPWAGEAYVCVKNAFLYTYSGVNNASEAYYIQEPGDDQFDVKNWNTTAEHLGTCMVSAQKSSSRRSLGLHVRRTALCTCSGRAACTSAASPSPLESQVLVSMTKAGSLATSKRSTSSGASVTVTTMCSNVNSVLSASTASVNGPHRGQSCFPNCTSTGQSWRSSAASTSRCVVTCSIRSACCPWNTHAEAHRH